VRVVLLARSLVRLTTVREELQPEPVALVARALVGARRLRRSAVMASVQHTQIWCHILSARLAVNDRATGTYCQHCDITSCLGIAAVAAVDAIKPANSGGLRANRGPNRVAHLRERVQRDHGRHVGQEGCTNICAREPPRSPLSDRASVVPNTGI